MRRSIRCCLAGSVLAAGTACAQTATPIQTVHYTCEQGKTIVAQYFDGPAGVAPNGMPIPGGRVSLVLGDGRRLALPQTLSGSGIRYADKGETVVFWSKGETAFLEEGPSQAVTYKGCVAAR